MEFDAVLQAILANPVSSTRRVSGELGSSQSNVVYVTFSTSAKAPRAAELRLNYGKTFDSLRHHHENVLIAQNPLTLPHHLFLLAIALGKSSRWHSVSA